MACCRTLNEDFLNHAVIAVGVRPFEFTKKEHNRLLLFMIRQSRPLSNAKFDMAIARDTFQK